MASFIFTCPHCKQQFNAEEEWIGESAECPECQRTIIIQKTEQQPLSVSSHRSRSILKKIILCSVLAIACISGALWITYMVVPSGITAKTKRSNHLPLLPDLKKSNDIDTENTCQSNLKQILLAMTMYCNDSNGKYPPQKDWNKVLLKDYVTDKKLLSCPADSSLYSYLGGNIDSTEKLQESSKIEILRCPKHRLVIFADGHVSHYSQQTNIAEKRVNEGDRVADMLTGAFGIKFGEKFRNIIGNNKEINPPLRSQSFETYSISTTPNGLVYEIKAERKGGKMGAALMMDQAIKETLVASMQTIEEKYGIAPDISGNRVTFKFGNRKEIEIYYSSGGSYSSYSGMHWVPESLTIKYLDIKTQELSKKQEKDAEEARKRKEFERTRRNINSRAKDMIGL